MKICFVTFFEDLLLKDTGPTVRIFHLAKGMASLGHKVKVIVASERKINKLINDNLKIHYINGVLPKKLLKKLGKFFGISRIASLYLYDVFFILRICRLILESDIVQIEEQEAGGLLIPFLSCILRKKVIVDCHDVFQALRIGNTSFIRKFFETFLEKIAYKFSSAILTVSRNEKNLLTLYGVNKDKIYVVPNGVDTKSFNSAVDVNHIKKKYGLEGARIVVFVGNLGYLPNKEAVQLIASKIAPHVRKSISNVKFLIVGRNPQRIKAHGLIFTGAVNNVAELLAASDIGIAPLLRGTGTRLKILEYFSCGLPVISTTVGIQGLDVKPYIHVLIEDDISKFASKIIELLNDKQLAIRLGKAARELVVNKYEWNNITRGLNNVYYDLLSKA